jgi:hypothetical protein
VKKFIYRYKISLLAALASFIIVFYCFPFSFTPPVPPCINTHLLCPYGPPVSLFDYLTNHPQITTIDWLTPMIAFVVLFVIFYGYIKLIILIAKFQNKKKKIWIRLVKIALIFAIIYIPFVVFYLFMSFFGFSLPSITLPFLL